MASFFVETLTGFFHLLSMKYTTFKDLTLRQYVELYSIYKSDMEDLEKIIQSVCLLTGLTEKDVDEMDLMDFNKVSREISVIFSTEVRGEPKKFISIAGKQYGITYTPADLKAGQYIEIQTWMADPINNMAKIMASLVYPIKKLGPFRFKGKYDSAKHPILSEQILDCNFIDVHSACVFFSDLWDVSIKSLQGFLARKIRKKWKITDRELTMILENASVGFLTQRKLQTLKT